MNIIRNAWYVAGFSTELNENSMVARRLVDVAVVMYRSSSGAVVALEDRCPHRLLPLSLGKRVGDDIQCGYHGMRFSEKGACVEAPGQTTWPKSACLRSYPLVDRHGLLWFWPGDESRADSSLIPDMHWNDDPGWAASRGYHYIEADFRLANDNLLDLSHETYVHEHTVGNGEEETIANYPMRVSVEGDCLVRAHREMPNIMPPPFFELVLNQKGRDVVRAGCVRDLSDSGA